MSIEITEPPKSPALPSSFRLSFSSAADNRRISDLFRPEVKQRIDPDNYVVKRDPSVFDSTIARGGAAFLHDAETGEVQTLTMAYHVRRNPKDRDHAYTEIGTSLTQLCGFSATKIVVAAMALREWWDRPPQEFITSEILPSNAASLHLYQTRLTWTPIEDREAAEELHHLCNAFIDAADAGRQTVWFHTAPETIRQMARTLVDLMEDGKLRNRDGGEIALDLTTGLAEVGLSKARLEAMADGVLSKPRLAAIGSAPKRPAPQTARPAAYTGLSPVPA